jgi:hypothetical protein
MSAFGCEACRALTPELALGIASGDERAAALRHLATCRDCRDDLRELTDAADQLLLAVPEAEPSAGFDERVVESLTGEGRRRWSRRTALMAAAAAIALALACGAVAGWLVGKPDTRDAEYAKALDDLNGRSLRVASLGLDEEASRVVAHDGDPSWLLVMVAGGLDDGEYSIVCEYEGGWSVTPGTVSVNDGRGTWAATVPRTLADLTGVRLQDANGDVAGASFG